MNIAIRGGHNLQAQGANGIVNEVTENRKILASTIKWLKIDKQTVLDVTPYSCISAEDLKRGVNDANLHNTDIFVSIHLNAGGGHGCEVLYYGSSPQGNVLAKRVSNYISELGFANRGAKSDVRGLYELRHTSMPAIVVEAFFCDSAADVILYQKLGVDKLGKSIAEGIVGHKINDVQVKIVNTTPTINYILKTQIFLNSLGLKDSNGKSLVTDGINGSNTKFAMNQLNQKL